MAIEYVKISEVPQKKGIEVTTEFTNGEKTVMKSFLFEDQNDIITNFDLRMLKAVENYKDNQERDITASEIVDKLINYFNNNTTLTKSQAVSFMKEKIIVGDSL